MDIETGPQPNQQPVSPSESEARESQVNLDAKEIHSDTLSSLLEDAYESIQRLGKHSRTLETLVDKYAQELNEATTHLQAVALEVEHGTSDIATQKYDEAFEQLEEIALLYEKARVGLETSFDRITEKSEHMQAIRLALSKTRGSEEQPQA
jgi:prefoldin subunit 5